MSLNSLLPPIPPLAASLGVNVDAAAAAAGAGNSVQPKGLFPEGTGFYIIGSRPEHLTESQAKYCLDALGSYGNDAITQRLQLQDKISVLQKQEAECTRSISTLQQMQQKASASESTAKTKYDFLADGMHASQIELSKLTKRYHTVSAAQSGPLSNILAATIHLHNIHAAAVP